MTIRHNLPNGNKWCHIYTDSDGVTNIHNTQTNETYRIIPEASSFGFYLEYHKDAEMVARNSLSFDELKVLALLAGSNHLLSNLKDKGGETNKESDWKKGKYYIKGIYQKGNSQTFNIFLHNGLEEIKHEYLGDGFDYENAVTILKTRCKDMELIEKRTIHGITYFHFV